MSTPFHLTGNFAPVHDELDVAPLSVVGELPRTLNGWYLRNGPNPSSPTPNWYVGQGMIHCIHFSEGQARSYRNQAIRRVERGGSANTHLLHHAGKLLALAETHLPVEIGAGLETLGAYDFKGLLTTAMTAHARVCPRTGELLFFGYQAERPYLTYYRADAQGRLVQRTPIEVGAATYMHDFAITERFVVFLDLPVLLTGSWFGNAPPSPGARATGHELESCHARLRTTKLAGSTSAPVTLATSSMHSKRASG